MSDKRKIRRECGRLLRNWFVCLLVILFAAGALGGCAAYGPMNQATSADARIHRDEDLKAFNEAVALTESLRYEEAAARFGQVFERLSNIGNRPKAAESLFWLGFCREKQGRLTEAGEIYRRVTQEYTSTTAAREAGERLSRLPK